MNSLLSVYFSWWLHKCSIYLLIGCLIYLGGWLCHWPSQQLAVYSQMVAGSAFGPAKIGCQIWHWLVTRIPGYNTFSIPGDNCTLALSHSSNITSEKPDLVSGLENSKSSVQQLSSVSSSPVSPSNRGIHDQSRLEKEAERSFENICFTSDITR